MSQVNNVTLKKYAVPIVVLLLLAVIAFLILMIAKKESVTDSNSQSRESSSFTIKNNDDTPLSSVKANTDDVDIELSSVDVGAKVLTANFIVKNSDTGFSNNDRYVAASKCPANEEMIKNQLFGKCFVAKLDEAFLVDTTSGNRINPLTDDSGNLNITKFGDGLEATAIGPNESTSFYIQFERPPGSPSVTFNLNFAQALGPIELRKK